MKRHLLGCYGSFGDKRIKKPEKGRTFIVDDRDEGDVAADGNLFGHFCRIFAHVDSDTDLVVSLSGNVPRSPAVVAFLKKRGLTRPGHGGIEMQVTRQNIGDLRELADIFDAIVVPGRRYQVPSYKYVCPRTAEALRRLAGYLDDYAWLKTGFF